MLNWQRYTGGFYASYGTLNGNELLRTQPKTGISISRLLSRYSSGKKYDAAFQNCQRCTSWFPPEFAVLWTKISYWAQWNHEGDTDIPFNITVYLFLSKRRCRFELWLELMKTYTTTCFLAVAKTHGGTQTWTLIVYVSQQAANTTCLLYTSDAADE